MTKVLLAYGFYLNLFVVAPAALSQRDHVAKQNVVGLIKDLSSDKRSLRIKATDRLFDLGPEASPAVPALAKALKDPVEEVSVGAAEALARIGSKAIPALIKALGPNSDERSREKAAYSIGRIGPKAKIAASALLSALDDKSISVRVQVAYALGDIGALESVPILTRIATTDGELKVRLAAMWSLGQFEVNSAEAVPALIGLLASSKELGPLENEAANTLAQIGQPALSSLVALLHDSKVPIEVRASVVWALSMNLAYHGRNSLEPVLPLLIQELGNREVEIRREMARVLGGMGKHAKTALPSLRARLRGSVSIWEELSVAQAIGLIDSDDKTAIQHLINGLRDHDPKVRGYAAQLLNGLRGNVQAAVPSLIDCLQDAEESVRVAAANTLGSNGADATASLAILERLKHDPSQSVRRAANHARRLILEDFIHKQFGVVHWYVLW